MGCDGLWSYLTNFVMRLKLEREKPSSPMYLPLNLSLYRVTAYGKPIYNKTCSWFARPDW